MQMTVDVSIINIFCEIELSLKVFGKGIYSEGFQQQEAELKGKNYIKNDFRREHCLMLLK